MLKVLRIILSIIVVAGSIYALITGAIGVMLPYLLLLVGLMLIVIGVIEFQKQNAGAFNL